MVGEHFKENLSPVAEARISWLGATFMRRFAVKIEDGPGDVTLQTYALNRSSSNLQIIAELDDVKQQIASGAMKIEPTREDARGGR